MPTFTTTFEQTLHRALALANEHHHEYATLEHFLWALTDDLDAAEVIKGCGGDIVRLRQNLTDYINKELDNLVAEGTEDSKPTAGFQRVVQRAVIHVQSSGREEVTGANALVAMFAERDSVATDFLAQQGFTREDAVNFIVHGTAKEAADRIVERYSPPLIERSIALSAESAPKFQAYRGKIRFRQSRGRGRIAERKAVVQERCLELQSRCGPRANEQHELKLLTDRYAAALSSLRKDRGAYRLFLIGLELEILLKAKAEAIQDSERNIPLDADLLFAARSLLVAHAGLIVLFPDIKNATEELDQYRKFSEAVDALRDRIVDPVLDELAASKGIFDEETHKITQEVKALANLENANNSPSQGTTATKHGWLRGALASIGQYLIRQIKESAKVVRDAVIKDEVSSILKNRNPLTKSILKFLDDAKDVLLSLADKLPSSFGWISALLSLFGLK